MLLRFHASAPAVPIGRRSPAPINRHLNLLSQRVDSITKHLTREPRLLAFTSGEDPTPPQSSPTAPCRRSTEKRDVSEKY